MGEKSLLAWLAIYIVPLVWSFTKEPKSQEKVFYEVENSGTFGSGTNKLSFFRIRIINNGNAKSSNLLFTINPKKNQSIKMHNFKRSPSKPAILKIISDKYILQFTIARLLPSEYVYVHVATEGIESQSTPYILAKNDEFLINESKPKDSEKNTNKYILFIQLFSFAMTPFAIRYAVKKLYNSRNLRFSVKSKNNSGFILLYSGLPAIAE